MDSKMYPYNTLSNVLSPISVQLVFSDCCPTPETKENDLVYIEGISHTAQFDRIRLERNRQNIIRLLDQLPDTFKRSKGGGWSFLNACMTQTGEQWTGFHWNMEQLFQLGMAIDYVECLLSRDMWIMLPGRMPYYVIKD